MTSHMPDGFHSVTPYFHVQGADRWIEFVRQAFNATVLERTAGPDGLVRNAAIRIGDSIVECSEGREPYMPMPMAIHLYVADTDEGYRSAMAAGGTTLYEPADMDYGERSAGVKDPFGNHWYIATYTGTSK